MPRFLSIHPLSTLSLLLLIVATLSFHQPPPPLTTCADWQIQAAQLPPYVPTDTQGWVQLDNGHFVVNGEPFLVRGVNYFPAQYPWRRFLTATDQATLQTEFTLLRNHDLNTLRIFLWYEALFDCPGSGAVPNVANFERLDTIIHTAATHDLRLIVTLNDGPDLNDYVLYSNPQHVKLQTALIVARYRDEPAILAWDLRNEGDIDYGSRSGFVEARFPRDQVLEWLAHSANWVRQLDDQHLITAGWMTDALATEPHVDFLSFHHWWDAADMQRRVADMRAGTDKPILLEEFGYSTFNVTPEVQAETIAAVIESAHQADLLGWLVWTVFDLPLAATCWPQPCVDAENHEHHFGLWYSDYSPKPAVQALNSPS